MAAILPYQATTATGDRLDFEFPLHAETGDPVRVAQMLSAVLASLDRDLKLDPTISNGDLLQALAMALAVRTEMIAQGERSAEPLTRELVDRALAAAREAQRQSPKAGHA